MKLLSVYYIGIVFIVGMMVQSACTSGLLLSPELSKRPIFSLAGNCGPMLDSNSTITLDPDCNTQLNTSTSLNTINGTKTRNQTADTSNKVFDKLKVDQISIYVLTHRANYITAQQIQILIWLNGPFTSQVANVEIDISRDNQVIFHATKLLPINRGLESRYAIVNLFAPEESGTYKITASTSLNNTTASAYTTISVTSLFMTTFSFFVYTAIASFGFLAFLIYRAPASHSKSEIIRFVCITSIVFSILAGLLLTDLQIGYYSPVGLVELNPPNPNSTGSREWVINIGGTKVNNFADGIQIPIYVVILGLVGGYLRYLYKTSKLKSQTNRLREIYLFDWDNVPGRHSSRLKEFLKDKFDVDWISTQKFVRDRSKISITNGEHSATIELVDLFANLKIDDKIVYQFVIRKNNKIGVFQTLSWRSWLFYQSLEDLSLLFLSPLLAVAVWFILTQAGTTASLTIALASFTVGLLTDEVIAALLRTVRPLLTVVSSGDISKEQGETKPAEGEIKPAEGEINPNEKNNKAK